MLDELRCVAYYFPERIFMLSRCAVFAIIAGVAIASWMTGAAEDVTLSWYPLQPGDTWIYQKESRDGNMAHPGVERWTTEESIVNTRALPELAGTLVTKRTRVLEHIVPTGFIPQNDSTKRELPESHLLIHRNCIYVLDGIDAQGSACDPNISGCVRPLDANNHVRPEYHNDLLRRKIPADLCFPMTTGATWGKVAITSPANEWVWHVKGFNADPFGPAGGRTFHLSSHLGSGTSIDRWFEEGVGVVQEVAEHHGTYDEDRRLLLRAVIGGKTQVLRLTPARTTPLSDLDCSGPGWRHYSRADGTSFRSISDCIAYSSKRP
jgi:hypothetical protein